MATLVLPAGVASTALAHGPIALCPDNPHYFVFRGRPAVLITSGEHYGAVLNSDFDYVPYLDEIARHGLNLTRTFSGVYCEAAGSFGIRGNPLAPRPERLICPWARSSQPGYAGGGNKFDLRKWDEAYFRRLKDFVDQAGRRGVVVELVLFCPFYRDEMWGLSPMNAENNVNGIGRAVRTDVYTLKHADLPALHEAVTRKIVAELKDFDNLYYEVCNEPYFGGVTDPWQDRIIAAIVDAEKDFPQKHLIAQNIANGRQKIENPNPAVSVFNFHYATPPDTVAMNFGLNRVIGDDETGFKGSGDFIYRAEGWDFMIAGGGVYDNLDYSFTPEHEAGTATPNAPGGGGQNLRRQLAILKRFVEGFDFVKMQPDDSVIRTKLPPSATARALVERGKQYAVYLRGDGVKSLTLALPPGRYRAEWIDTKTGAVEEGETFEQEGETKSLEVPAYREDIALRIRGTES
ncbi:MAG TPA: cellulase family glycosylhydrolase [Thermoguttaceae bacterium]|nr:cellulase family glycosylhydrolase [Thermoguttaceae bacterium]